MRINASPAVSRVNPISAFDHAFLCMICSGWCSRLMCERDTSIEPWLSGSHEKWAKCGAGRADRKRCLRDERVKGDKDCGALGKGLRQSNEGGKRKGNED